MASKVDDNLPSEEISNKDSRFPTGPSTIKAMEREKDSETIKRLASDAVELLDNVEMDDVQKMRDKEDRKRDFPKKWAGPLIVGAFVPAVYALILIFSGQIVLNSMGSTCFYPLNTLLSVEIVVSYLFLVAYSWIFLGDDIKIKISYLKIDWHLFAPYVSLELLVVFYSILGAITILVTVIGTYLLFIAESCIKTATALYGYTLFTILMNWVGIVTITGNLMKLKMKDIDPEAFLIRKNRTATITEIEETMFLKKFRDFDPKKNGFINAEVFYSYFYLLILLPPARINAIH